MAHTRKQIEKVFQQRFEDVFEEFDEEPIGTGAIAQVCCCRYHGDSNFIFFPGL
jgi:predicted unusual protein kinase regulating ubiquinone biosynthesis (AarF/ABC1/UbiB family)